MTDIIKLRKEVKILSEKMKSRENGMTPEEFTEKVCSDIEFGIEYLKIYKLYKEKVDELDKFNRVALICEKLAECQTLPKSPELKCMYILEMSNKTVKIGCTKDFKKRMRNIVTGSGLGVMNWCRSEYISAREAYYIEGTCHKAFDDCRVLGEFFDVDFEKAVTELKKHTPIVESMF